MLFKVKRTIEERIGEQSTVVQQQCNEQAAQTSVAIEEGMDGLELHVGDGGLEQHGQADGVVVAKMVPDRPCRRQRPRAVAEQKGAARACAADPVPRQKRRLRPRTTDSRHDHKLANNLLAKLPTPERPGQLWQSDITYIETQEGCCIWPLPSMAVRAGALRTTVGQTWLLS